ncbi:aldehyde dehydrogenase family protein [Planctomycetota bacterium]|nr:aldehyde dehydrogenase family protein [Planctomycetota bacterium]
MLIEERQNQQNEFRNEPMRDFSDKQQRDSFSKAINKSTINSVRFIDEVQAIKLIDAAESSFEFWRSIAVYQRAAKLLRAAEIIRQSRDYLSGIIIKESGKVWREADADVCEAIDFLQFYARCAVEMSLPEKLGSYPGELNEHWGEPRGITVVISPWNFPLAIATGMVAAALVTGNPVILKPAEQTSYIAKILVDFMHQAGVPRQVLLFAPGVGETVGAALVKDPRVATIAFTGSKEVGLDIIRTAYDTQSNQSIVKRVISEMGGKNAIIVDDSADLDQAVIGVRSSAFDFSGQKCSACSRCIVHKEIYDQFVNRLVASTKTLIVGDPMEPGTDVGPLIDEAAAGKVKHYVEVGKKEGKLAIGLNVPDGLEDRVGKPYVAPHIYTGINQNHKIANEEVFGPVLAIIKADSFEHALKIANATNYKLTGGVFSRKPSNLKLAKEKFRVGNLYINRSITGALVSRQPFGGFGLSGVGEKAGGAYYLRQFTVPRVCTENTMRRGFAPELKD